MKIAHLRTKIALVVIPLIILGSFGILIASNLFIMPGFQQIENDSAIKDSNRAVDALKERINQLDQKASDWANWDDTYVFMNDHNQKYIASNLQNQSLANLGVDYMLYYNAANKLVEMRHVQIDVPGLPSLGMDQGVKDLFTPNSSLLIHSSLTDVHNGIVDSPDGIMLVVSRPILTSLATGPSRGTLVFAQYLDAPAQQELAMQTHLNLKYLVASDVSISSSVPNYPSTADRGNQWVNLLSSSRSQAFAVIPDIFGKPSIVARVDLDRTISRQGRKSMDTFILGTRLIGLLTLIILSLALDRIVVGRILGFSKVLQSIEDFEDSRKVVVVRGNDELAKLGVAINDLVARLRKTYTLKQDNTKLEQKVTERTKELDDQLDQMRRINLLMVDRELRMKELKAENAELRKQFDDDTP